MKNFKISKTSENPKGLDPFMRSGRVGRSPPAADKATASNEPVTVENLRVNDPFKRSGRVACSPPTADKSATSAERNTPVTASVVAQTMAVNMTANCTPQQNGSSSVPPRGSSSPHLELIYKMRALEEESVAHCRAVLRKMKMAMMRQKNVSNDIKDGVSELAEQFDVLERYRKSWKAAEEERQSTAEVKIRDANETETPLASAKRIATSPAETSNGTGKKMREKEPQVWQVVQRKGKRKPADEGTGKKQRSRSTKRNRPGRTRPEAVLIKPSEGNSYADVLKSLRTEMQPNEAAKVRGIRKTRTGGLLLEFSRGERIQTSFVEELRSTVRQAGQVTELKPMATLEIRDLDSFTSKEEVEEAIRKQLDSDEMVSVRITTPNSREQVRAFVTLPAENAAILLKLGKIKIGWIRATIRLWINTKRCFRCMGVGHMKMDCGGPDRSNLCLKCGDPGHRISLCTSASKCCLCVDAGRERFDHFPASRGCPEFKAHRT